MNENKDIIVNLTNKNDEILINYHFEMVPYNFYIYNNYYFILKNNNLNIEFLLLYDPQSRNVNARRSK